MSSTLSAIEFARTARALASAIRGSDLTMPGFRSPPRLVGIDRSLRRHENGAVVAVRLKGRPASAVVSDMIEGVVVANGLQPPQSDRLRARLWTAVDVDDPTLASVA